MSCRLVITGCFFCASYHTDKLLLIFVFAGFAISIVNVFLPLISLTMKHGPTEFCIGTHILGNEDYDKDLIETPLSGAGTPIIFDYRLGHRGMANTSGDPRPYV